MLIVEQELCRPGAEVNEDLVWHDGHHAAVLDGSSTLAGATHDAVGFVELFAKRFAAQAVRDMTLASCVNAAIASLRDEFVPSSYPEGIVPADEIAGKYEYLLPLGLYMRPSWIDK
jgi:hypothetical protein